MNEPLGQKPKRKSNSSLKVYQAKLRIADNLGKDIDELLKMKNSEINTLYRNIYGNTLTDNTMNAYKRVWKQITINYNEQIKQLEEYISNTNDKSYIKKLNERIVLYKKYDILEREKIIENTVKDFKNHGIVGKEMQKIMKNRLWLRMNRVKMSNPTFEKIVNDLVENHHVDRRIALEHARLLAKAPKDEIAQAIQDKAPFITESGIEIPEYEVESYKKDTPSVIVPV